MSHEQLMKVATDCYKNYDGYSEEATSELLTLIMDDESLLSEALHWAASEALREVQRQARVKIANQPITPKTFPKEQQAVVVEKCFTYLYWPMMTGGFLKDATREQILQEADRYRSFKEGNAMKERFMRLVASKLKEGEKGGSLREEVFHQIHNQARIDLLVGEEFKYVG